MNIITPDTMKTLALGVGTGLGAAAAGHLLGNVAGFPPAVCGLAILGTNQIQKVAQENQKTTSEVQQNFAKTVMDIGGFCGRVVAATCVAANPVASATVMGINIISAAHEPKRSMLGIAGRIVAGGLIAYGLTHVVGNGGMNSFCTSAIITLV